MTGGQRFLMAGNGIRLFRGTCAYFIFSSWRALRARASGLTAIVLLCEVLQEERDLGCAVKEQGETSVQ